MDAKRMRCGAAIAVKRRDRGKSQLAVCLSPQERIELVRGMLGRVLAATRAARSVAFTVVVSPERDTIAEDVALLIDEGAGMNEAFRIARAALRARGARMMLALPADLPRVAGAELDALVDAAGDGGIAIAPDGRGSGTNALVVPVDLPMRFCFGPDSRRLHGEEARRLGVQPSIVVRPGLGFDVDVPADLASWRSQERAL